MGSADPITEQVMMRYLLGELSAEETDRFEERYFTDDETFDRLLAVKSDLIDLYVHGQLNKEETDKFESFFLNSPNHRQEVALVRSLLKMESTSRPFAASPVIVQHEPASLIEKIFGALPAWVRLAAGAFAALLIVGFAWLLIANQRMRAELNTLRAEQQTAIAREQELLQQVAALQSQSPKTTQTPSAVPSPTPSVLPSPHNEPSLASVFAITLAPGQSRNSGPTNQADLPTGTSKIRLRLLLDRDFGYRSYAVALKNAGDKTIQTRTGLHLSGDAIIAEFSADKLASGEYAATLSGAFANGQMEEIADYPFRIAKQ